uniref:Uncharacterized protein n=1 Tax=viral metagenome TaxID=1070528 RepID=A0A6C0I104_9ZZZZ
MNKTNNYLKCLFRDYYIFSEEEYTKFLIFLRENKLNERGDVFIHTGSYDQIIDLAKYFATIANTTATSKEMIAAMKAPISPETVQEFLTFLHTIDDQFVPERRDYIFQRFKQEIVDNFNVRMSLDGLSKTAVYYILMNEIIPGLRIQFQDSREMPYTQNGIQHSYKLAKLLASLWIAIVIPDITISESIFHHFNDIYTNKWLLDGIDSMLMAYIAFGGGERRIIEFEESQRASREESREIDSTKISSEGGGTKTSK